MSDTELIVSSGRNKKTLYYGWQYDQSQPKDYDPYLELGGSNFRSTYKRLGTWTGDELKTESSLAQRRAVEGEPSARSTRRSMINMLSYPATLGERRRRYWKHCGIQLPPENSDSTDYSTVYDSDYINYCPDKLKMKPRAEMMKPETKFRRLLVDGADPRRPGINTFYDDNMDHLKKQAGKMSPPPYALAYSY